MLQHKLTVTQIANAKPRDKAYTLGDGDGLWLVVHPTGRRNWVLRYARHGQRHEMGLGPYPTIDLKAARTQAQQHRALLLDGQDPLATRRRAQIDEARRGKLFAAAVEEYVQLHEEEWKHPRQAAHWRAQLRRYAFPFLGELPI